METPWYPSYFKCNVNTSKDALHMTEERWGFADEKAWQILDEADDFIEKGEFNEAIKYCDGVLDTKTVSRLVKASAYIIKGNGLREQENYDEAIECYNKVLKMKTVPDRVKALAYITKVICLHKLGKYDEAIECYNKVLKMKTVPDRVKALAYKRKSQSLYKQRKYDKAIKCCDKALTLEDVSDEGKATIFFNKGQAIIGQLKTVNNGKRTGLEKHAADAFGGCFEWLFKQPATIEKKTLYKFMPINLNKLSELAQNTLFFACPKDYNDPFDCTLFSYPDSLKASLDKVRICAFVDGDNHPAFENILMWSHYAASHTGMCIEYAFDHASIDHAKLCEIKYKHTRDVRSLDDLLKVKYKHWAYEKEWRLIRYHNDMPDKNNHLDLNQYDIRITSITFGVDARDNDINIIRHIKQSAEHLQNTALYKMRYPEDGNAFHLSKEALDDDGIINTSKSSTINAENVMMPC